MEPFEDDGTWIWVAYDPEHQVMLTHVVGERKQHSANKRVKQRVLAYRRSAAMA
jgi:IS1 family transposase